MKSSTQYQLFFYNCDQLRQNENETSFSVEERGEQLIKSENGPNTKKCC